jgi:predicted MFS family arabinose efflux permease
MAPAALGAFFGGSVTDRIAPRLVSVISDLACFATVGVIAALQVAGQLRFWELCALMAATGLLHPPGDAARMVMLPAVAEAAETPLAKATGYYAGASRAASAVGAAAAGVAIFTLGVAQALFIDAATFAVSALLVAFWVPGLARKAGHSLVSRWPHELGAGIRLLARTPLLLGLCVTLLLAQTLDQGWSAVILPVDVHDKLHSIVVFGIAESAFAAGALTGTIVYSVLADRLPRWPVFTLGFLVVGMPRFAVAALTAGPAPLIAVMAIEGLACGPITPITNSVIYELTPEAMRGRVIGAMTALPLIATPFGALAAGVLIARFGLTAATLAFGGIYFVTTLAPVAFPLYRQMDTVPGPLAHPARVRRASWVSGRGWRRSGRGWWRRGPG